MYSEFVNSLKLNLDFIYVAPKIIVYTSNPNKFIETNKDYNNSNNAFYRFGGVTNTFEKLKDFIKNDRNNVLEIENKPKKIKEKGASHLIFEHIDTKEKLLLPMLFKTLIKKISNENVKNFTKILARTYSNENDDLKTLLCSIGPMANPGIFKVI